MKRYTLIKDLPDLKAGVIFLSGADGIVFYYKGETQIWVYPKKVIEQTEWFKEVCELE